jgi:regulator of sirC expression with transglutaminase-like and TPR domain
MSDQQRAPARILVVVDSEIRHDFAAAIAGADHDVDLFGGAIAIARLSGSAVDAHAVARELDRFAESVRDDVGDVADVEALAHAIDHELFTVRGFHGNATDYSDPANSYLDEVVARRTGIPITMSLVYMEVAQRVGLRCDGIGYPGHFIVRCGPPDSPLYVDPFQQGIRLDRDELLANLRSARLGGATPESFLAAVTRRQLLQRMLNNLHVSFRDRRDLARWREAVELLLLIEPWNAALVGERGMLNYRLGNRAEALIDLERYVAAGEPQSVNAGARRLLDELRLQFGSREELR